MVLNARVTPTAFWPAVTMLLLIASIADVFSAITETSPVFGDVDGECGHRFGGDGSAVEYLGSVVWCRACGVHEWVVVYVAGAVVRLGGAAFVSGVRECDG